MLFYFILWHAIKLIILIAWNVHKYYIDIVLWTFLDILHRIYPQKLSGYLWHTFLFTGVFAKGQIFHIRLFFIRNVERILAEVWPKIYFQSFSKMLCVYSDFPITIPIDSSPDPTLIKKNVTAQFKTITFSSSLEITWILHLHYMIILHIRQPSSERI